MKAPRCTFALTLLCVSLPAVGALATEPKDVVATVPVTTSSSSTDGVTADGVSVDDLPNAPGRVEAGGWTGVKKVSYTPFREPTRKPFSTLAIGVKVGLEGGGVEVATPLSRRFGLRGGVNYFAYNPDFTYDGLVVTGDINLRSGFGTLDIFPFDNGFRISAGAAYNGSLLNAKVLIPGGTFYTLGDGASTLSSPTDPVHGTFGIDFGRKIAPRLTIGSGNMIPRKGGHISFPFELGMEYLGRQPRASLYLEGTACQQQGCGQVQSDPTAQMDLAVEVAQINQSIPAALRFFPVVSIGVSFRFGHDRQE